MAKLPTFQWGGRVANAPPTPGFPGWFNINSTDDFSVSLTKVMGRHTIKTGFYNTHSYKAEQTSNNAFGTINFQQDAVGTNPFDTSYGFANAAIGTFSSFLQAQKYVETTSIYNNTEAYIQDNWKVVAAHARLRGAPRAPAGAVRHAQSGVELPAGSLVAVAGAGAVPAGLPRRRLPLPEHPAGEESDHRPAARPEYDARDRDARPQFGQHAERHLPPGRGRSAESNVFRARAGGSSRASGWPTTSRASSASCSAAAPGCTSIARTSSPFSQGVNNPTTSGTITVPYSNLQALGSGGLTTEGAPGLNASPENIDLPTSIQWNGGADMTLPWAMALDAWYIGHTRTTSLTA